MKIYMLCLPSIYILVLYMISISRTSIITPTHRFEIHAILCFRTTHKPYFAMKTRKKKKETIDICVIYEKTIHTPMQRGKGERDCAD